MKKITLVLAVLFAICYTHAQTTLAAGDIAFLGSNTDAGSTTTDNVSFVLLKDIDAATQIIFTDRGWNDTGGFSNFPGDGELTWTSGIARSAGDVIVLDLSNGELNNSGAYSSIGDQLFALQGSIASPVFIAGLHFNVVTGVTDDANWDGSATTNSTSALPNALSTGNTAVRLTGAGGIEFDNFQFSCTAAGGSPITGTAAAIRVILHNATNWSSNSSTGFNPPVEAGCTISIATASDAIAPVITCAATPADITAGLNGMAAIPDLVTGSSATDNVSTIANITITQSPTAGTLVGVGVNMVTVTAMDEAGNTASCMIDVTVLEPLSTSLTAGDIAFVGFNLDGTDAFAFIILEDIIAGTNIKFTDCGVANPNTIMCSSGDSSFTWYAPSAITAGTIVTLPGSSFPGPLASQGDQILAYQGTTIAPTFLAGIHANVEPGVTNDADWDGGVTMLDESALPDQLTNGVNALRVHATETEIDNWQLDCSSLPPGSLSGTKQLIAAVINDLQYWVSDNTTEFSPTVNPACTFTILPEDNTAPTVTIDQEAAQVDPSNTSPINFTVEFNEPVTGFATDDVTLSGTANATTGVVTEIAPNDGTTYNVAVSGMTGDGTVIATVGAGVAQDLGGNPNEASTSTDNQVIYDTMAPTVTVDQETSQADPTATSPINFTVVFSELVGGFIAGDVTLGGTAGATTAVVTGGPTSYNVAVSGMTGDGTVIVTLGAGVVTDTGGNPNEASTSTDNQVIYDTTATTVTIDQAATQADPTATSPINFTVVFNEPVTGFISGDVTLSGTANPTTDLVTEIAPNDGTTYNVAVSGMTGDGTVIATVGVGVAQDPGGNPNEASTSTDNEITYDATPPTLLSIERLNPLTSPTNADNLQWVLTFSEVVSGTFDVLLGMEVTGPVSSSITVTSGDNSGYTYFISGVNLVDFNGTVGLDIKPINSITDVVGNPLLVIEPPIDETYVLDNTAPTLVSTEPIDDAIGVAEEPVLTATFNEPMQFASGGEIVIQDLTAGTLFGTIDVSGPIIFSANGFTIDPMPPFVAGNEYEVQIPGTALQDAAGNPFAGIPGLGWTFNVTDPTGGPCPDDLVNDDPSLVLPSGTFGGGLDSAIGTSTDTNGSPCALIVGNDDSGEPWSHYRISLNLVSLGIATGDQLLIGVDGKSNGSGGSGSRARLAINYDNGGNNLLDGFTFGSEWSRYQTTITVPSGITTLDLWFFSNFAQSTPGSAVFDNLVVTNLSGGGGNINPIANAGSDVSVSDDDTNGTEMVSLNGSGSSDADGTLASYVWRENGTTIATGVQPSVSFTVGVHTVLLTVTDDGGSTDTDTVVVTVTDPTGGPCPDDLVNDDPSLVLPSGTFGGGLDSAIGTSTDTNGSPCALIVGNDDSGEPWSHYRISLNLVSLGIATGDQLLIRVDGKSNGSGGSGSRARIAINYDNGGNNLLDGFTFGSEWSRYQTTITVPSGITTLDLWFFSNFALSAPGSAVFDNLVVTNLSGGGGNIMPIANAGSDVSVSDDDTNGTEMVSLNGSGSSDADGTLASYVWSENGTTIATGVQPSVSFTVGVHTVLLTVTDDGGSTDTDTVVVTVTDPSGGPCPDDLVNEDPSLVLPSGTFAGGLDSALGTSTDTNGSPCALIVGNDDSSEPWSHYRISLNLASLGIATGDQLLIGVDGKSNGSGGSGSRARIAINYDNGGNNLLDGFTFGSEWSRYQTTITVPSGITTLDLWFFSNFNRLTPGSAVFDNLVVTNLSSASTGKSVQETKPLNGLNLYPNPATYEVSLSFDLPTVTGDIQIFDVTGRLVKTIKKGTYESGQPIGVQEFEAGLYFLRTQDAIGQQLQKKMVIKR